MTSPAWRPRSRTQYIKGCNRSGELRAGGKIIGDNLSKAGWSWSCVSTVDSNGQTTFVADAYRGDGRRFIVHADEKLSAFVELERLVLTVTFYLESIHSDSCR
jgi:hypothetical protein